MPDPRVGAAQPGLPFCVVVGDDAPLAAAVVWSLPVEQIDGYGFLGGQALPHRLPGCRRHVEIELSDREAALAGLRELVRQRRGAPVLAIAADDAGCTLLAGVTLDGLMVAPVPGVEALARLRDKWSFHELCLKLGTPTPATWKFASKADIDIDRCLVDGGGTVVIKPVDQKGGLGVVEIATAGAFRRQVLDNPAYAFAPLIVQTFVPGVDIDISVLALDGRIEHQAIQTCEGDTLRFLDHPPLTAAVETLVRETSLSGFAHFDARWRPDGQIALLECNVRPWATLSKATWCGLNFIRAAIDAARDRPTGEPAALTSGVALRPDAWVLSSLWRPWRWFDLGPDQRRILFGAVFVFATMGWRDRWSRLAGLFGPGRER